MAGREVSRGFAGRESATFSAGSFGKKKGPPPGSPFLQFRGLASPIPKSLLTYVLEANRPALLQADRPALFQANRAALFQADRPALFQANRATLLQADRPALFQAETVPCAHRGVGLARFGYRGGRRNVGFLRGLQCANQRLFLDRHGVGSSESKFLF